MMTLGLFHVRFEGLDSLLEPSQGFSSLFFFSAGVIRLDVCAASFLLEPLNLPTSCRDRFFQGAFLL